MFNARLFANIYKRALRVIQLYSLNELLWKCDFMLSFVRKSPDNNNRYKFIILFWYCKKKTFSHKFQKYQSTTQTNTNSSFKRKWPTNNSNKRLIEKNFHLVIYLKDRTPHFIIGGVILGDRQNATYVCMYVFPTIKSCKYKPTYGYRIMGKHSCVCGMQPSCPCVWCNRSSPIVQTDPHYN